MATLDNHTNRSTLSIPLGFIGLATLLALTSACTAQCIDDGFAWSQSQEECVAMESATDSSSDSDSNSNSNSNSNTNTETDTSTTTATSGETDTSTSTGGTTLFCKDADMDGQGDPDDCMQGDADNPPPGYVPNDLDCDDDDENTYTGAAEIEDPTACMTDVDDDGWGEPMPAPGVIPGTDCDDNNVFAFPGAAEIEDPKACMEDEDDDGWGDTMPGPGIDPGQDCVDTDPNTYPGAAEKDDPDTCMTDEDGDGYGDNDPRPGSTPGTDCDDGEIFTFPGSSPNDDPLACMKDADDDDWGDVDPPDGVIPGSDCDDSNEFTFPGAAENEVDPEECRRDVDEDGFGDDDPPDGVVSGTDCNDTDAMVVLNCADCEPDMLFCEGDELHLCNMNGTGSELQEVCEFGCDMENLACFELLAIDAGESVCIDKGAMAQLQAMTIGGDGNYVWDWTPADTLNDPTLENPLATPPDATTYTVTVTDGKNAMASDSVSVFIKDASLVLDDVSCKITNFAWGGAPNVNWNWNPDLVELCQQSNSTPTARFCGWSLDNANIQGRFQIKTGADDDYVGFLWGIQPFDQMTMEPEQFYYMGWKQGNQLGFCGGGQSGRAGIIVKRIDVKDANNAPLTCQDFHEPSNTTNSTLLADEMNFTQTGWLDNVAYIFDLTHTPTGFTIKIIREDNMVVIAEKEFIDDTYPNGQVGFYAYSQQNTCFSQFKTNCL